MALPSTQDVKLWLALLHEIELRGGQAKPQDVYGTIRGYFPEITDEDASIQLTTGGNKLTNRIQWARQRLVERGCIDASVSGTWRITPLGRDWLNASWKGSNADYSAVVKPAKLPKPGDGVKPPASPSGHSGSTESVTESVKGKGKSKGQAATAATGQAPVAALASSAAPSNGTGSLSDRLLKSQHQSSTPQQFEKDLAEAFAALGFEAEHIGGSGETDIHVSAPLGQSSYSVVVDAKSTASTRIPEAQINWLAIDSHRKARGATYAAVVGPDFGGGNLLKFAGDFGIVLIRTDMIRELLQLHAATPLSLFELRDLFLSPGLADNAMKPLRERHNQHRRHWALIGEIADTLPQFGPDGLKHDNLYHILRALAISRGRPLAEAPTQQDVADAIAFLASRAVGVLAEVQGSGGAYRMTMSTKTARERLHALAHAVDQRSGSEAAASVPAEPGLSAI